MWLLSAVTVALPVSSRPTAPQKFQVLRRHAISTRLGVEQVTGSRGDLCSQIRLHCISSPSLRRNGSEHGELISALNFPKYLRSLSVKVAMDAYKLRYPALYLPLFLHGDAEFPFFSLFSIAPFSHSFNRQRRTINTASNPRYVPSHCNLLSGCLSKRSSAIFWHGRPASVIAHRGSARLKLDLYIYLCEYTLASLCFPALQRRLALFTPQCYASGSLNGAVAGDPSAHCQSHESTIRPLFFGEVMQSFPAPRRKGTIQHRVSAKPRNDSPSMQFTLIPRQPFDACQGTHCLCSRRRRAAARGILGISRKYPSQDHTSQVSHSSHRRRHSSWVDFAELHLPTPNFPLRLSLGRRPRRIPEHPARPQGPLPGGLQCTPHLLRGVRSGTPRHTHSRPIVHTPSLHN